MIICTIKQIYHKANIKISESAWSEYDSIIQIMKARIYSLFLRRKNSLLWNKKKFDVTAGNTPINAYSKYLHWFFILIVTILLNYFPANIFQ